MSFGRSPHHTGSEGQEREKRRMKVWYEWRVRHGRRVQWDTEVGVPPDRSLRTLQTTFSDGPTKTNA